MPPKFKHILITGASSGIGQALAENYAAPGVMLSLTGRNTERLASVTANCRAKGADVFAKAVCVTDAQAMHDFMTECDTRQPVDLVIANAGVSGGTGGDAAGEGMKQTRTIFDINVGGVFNTVEPLLPRMLQRKSGQIALMASLAGFRGWPGAPAYCASKAAVKVYGEGLRGSLLQTGVKVNVICPGFVVSRMTDANDFSMPFLMDTDQAANIIIKGLQRNKGRIWFPLPAYLMTRFFCALPDDLAIKFLAKLPAKPVSL